MCISGFVDDICLLRVQKNSSCFDDGVISLVLEVISCWSRINTAYAEIDTIDDVLSDALNTEKASSHNVVCTTIAVLAKIFRTSKYKLAFGRTNGGP